MKTTEEVKVETWFLPLVKGYEIEGKMVEALLLPLVEGYEWTRVSSFAGGFVISRPQHDNDHCNPDPGRKTIRQDPNGLLPF
jgi:hypothetical protein